jgi:hypothetical protein
MKMATITRQVALGLALLYAAVPLVHAQEELVVVETIRPTLFMSGGVDKDEEAYMRRMGKDFNLRVEFSERKDNEFVADADLTITDMRGNPVFALPKAGPIVNVKLPDGRYRVAATFHGKTETQLVTLRGKPGQDLYFHWKGSVKIDPYDGKPMGGVEIPG